MICGSIGPREACGCITISSAPKAKIVAALNAINGTRTVTLSKRSRRIDMSFHRQRIAACTVKKHVYLFRVRDCIELIDELTNGIPEREIQQRSDAC